jgi:hypothetical protein
MPNLSIQSGAWILLLVRLLEHGVADLCITLAIVVGQTPECSPTRGGAGTGGRKA